MIKALLKQNGKPWLGAGSGDCQLNEPPFRLNVAELLTVEDGAELAVY